MKPGTTQMPELMQQRCAVRECGAMVVVGEVDGRPLALNPSWIDVAVPDGQGRLTLTRGLQPHGVTCVDTSERMRHHLIPARA
jgi:hypothetical protein